MATLTTMLNERDDGPGHVDFAIERRRLGQVLLSCWIAIANGDYFRRHKSSIG